MTGESFKNFWSLSAKSTGRRLGASELTEGETAAYQEFRDRYDDAVRSFDDYLGHLLAFLDRRGLREKTVIIVTADHGEPLGDEDIRVRTIRDITRGVIWVPVLIHDPRHPVASRRFEPITSASLPALVQAVLDKAAPIHAPMAVAGDPLAPYATDGAHILRDVPGLNDWMAWPGEKPLPTAARQRELRSALAAYRGSSN